jgi:hypothetical protein
MTWMSFVYRPRSAVSRTPWLLAAGPLLAAGALLAMVGGCEPQGFMGHDASLDTIQPDSPFVAPDGSTPCSAPEDCDDGVPCTRDSCNPLGYCSHVIDNEICQDDLFCNGFELCDAIRGCVDGPRQSCDDGMVCTIDRCDEATKSCMRMPRDLDEDGDVDFFCDGTDCDDRDPTVSGMTSEICDDFVDNNCDGMIDEAGCGRPPYDVCDAPLAITESGTYPITLTGAGADYTLGCVGMARQDVVLSLTLTEPHDVRIAADADFFTTVLALRTTCDDVSTETECVSGFPGTVRRRALDAGTYFIIVTGYGTGDVVVTVDLTDPTPPPTNESCTSPIDVSAGGHFEGTFLDVRDDHLVGCGFGGSPDVVYTFTLTDVSDVQIDARSVTGEALSWAVGTTCGSTVGEERCAYGTPASGTLHELAAGTYFLVVEGPTYVEVDFTLDVTIRPGTPPIHGDLCTDPIELTLGTPYTGTLVGSEDDYETSCGYHYRDVIHTFTFTEASDVTIDINGGTSYLNASLRPTCDTGGTQLRCDAGAPLHSRIRGMAPGTYYLVLEAGRGGSYTVLVTATSPPSTPMPVTGNDSCGGAINIPMTGGLFSGSTITSLNDYTATTCGGMATSPDATFRLDLTRRSLVTATTDGSSFDTVLYYFTGSCHAGGGETACDDDSGSGSTSLLSRVLEAGTYFFIVDGFGTGTSGDYVFEVLISDP